MRSDGEMGARWARSAVGDAARPTSVAVEGEVGGATAARQQAALVRAPRDCFHSGFMRSELKEWLVSAGLSTLPHHQLIVITP